MPDTSCDLPGSLNGQLSNAPLFGLAPGGVYKASPVTQGTGALLPHLFTLTPLKCGAVYFLLHFPSRHRDSTLWSTLPYGVRTFLWIFSMIQRPSGLLGPYFLSLSFGSFFPYSKSRFFQVYNPLTIGAKFQAVAKKKFIIQLRRKIHITSMT